VATITLDFTVISFLQFLFLGLRGFLGGLLRCASATQRIRHAIVPLMTGELIKRTLNLRDEELRGPVSRAEQN
jgi:hypothetical protein